jgi:hypothetical protein
MLLLMGWGWKIRPCRYHDYPRCCKYFSYDGHPYTHLFDMKSLMARIGSRYDLITLASKIRTALVMVATRTQLPSYIGQDESNALQSIHSHMEGPRP